MFRSDARSVCSWMLDLALAHLPYPLSAEMVHFDRERFLFFSPLILKLNVVLFPSRPSFRYAKYRL